MRSSLSAASVKIYSKAWDEYRLFHLNQYGTIAKFPVSTEEILTFIAHLDLQKLAKATVRTYISAIGYPHRLTGAKDPTLSGGVRKVLDAAGSLATVIPKKLPITLDILEMVVRAASVLFSPYKATLMQALFSTAFHLCTRIGELTVSNGKTQHVLSRDQITFIHSQGSVSYQVLFKTFKHSKKGQTSSRNVLPTQSLTCPIRLLQAYISLRPAHLPNTAPLFAWSSGSSVKSQEVGKALGLCLKASGLDPASFSTHGFRLGSATEAAKKGASDAEIRMLGRWSSSAFLTYIRPQVFAFQY